MSGNNLIVPTTITFDTQHPWVEMGIFKNHDGCLFIQEYNNTETSMIWGNILPGCFRVFLNTTQDDGDIRKGNLLLIHESLNVENINVQNVFSIQNQENASWYEDQYHAFDAVDRVIKIHDPDDYDKSISNSDLFASLQDNLAVILGNMVIFSVAHKPLINVPKILKKDHQVIAIYIENISSEINTPNRQLTRACKLNDMEEVKRLLSNPQLSKDVQLNYNGYEACNQAYLYSHHELIHYFLTSSQFFAHDLINSSKYIQSTFDLMCMRNSRFMCELIAELPFFRLEQMIQFFVNISDKFDYKHQLLQAINVRKLYEKLEKDIPTLSHEQQENNSSLKI